MAFIKRQWARQADGEGLSLAIEEVATGSAVGLIVMLLRSEPFVAGLGYWVVPGARGHRLAARAVGLLSQWVLRQALVRRLEAVVEPDNVASLRTLQRCGFQKEGLLRSYLDGRHDVLLHSLVASDVK